MHILVFFPPFYLHIELRVRNVFLQVHVQAACPKGHPSSFRRVLASLVLLTLIRAALDVSGRVSHEETTGRKKHFPQVVSFGSGGGNGTISILRSSSIL